MKNLKKEKSPSRRRPSRKRKRTVEPSPTTNRQAAFKQNAGRIDGQSEEVPVQNPKRVSKGADEEME